MKLPEIKKKHTKITKFIRPNGMNGYNLYLVIDQQSFIIGHDLTSINMARWGQRQLALALERLLNVK